MQPCEPIKIMTFNIRGAIYEDGSNHWRYRAPLNVQLLRRLSPDLIGFQELHLANLEAYRQQLPEYRFYLGNPYNDQEPYQYPAIFWKSSGLTLLEAGGFWLSQSPERHSRAWDTACIRSAAWVRLRWTAGQMELLHLNTHLDHVSELARVEGARLILERLAAHRLPQIITGDFNCIPGSQAYQEFVHQGFVDAFPAAGGVGQHNTYHGFQGAAYSPRPHEADRIDWILIKNENPDSPSAPGLKVESCAIIQDGHRLGLATGACFPSDHYPVVAQLASRRASLPKEGSSHPEN